MGNDSSKKARLFNEDEISKTKRFSFSRKSQDNNTVKDKHFDITEGDMKELQNIIRRASFTPFYVAHYFV